MDSSTQDSDPLEFNPMDLFCTSIDVLRGGEIDQTIPPDSGWSLRTSRPSGVAGGHATGRRISSMMSSLSSSESSDAYDHEEIRSMCRRGIPPSLRRAAWIINVVSAANPDMSKSDCDDFGTFRKARVIGKTKLIVVEIHRQLGSEGRVERKFRRHS